MAGDVKGKAMSTKVKGKTKAKRAKKETKATSLKEFLSILATDARKLGEFLHQPEAAMSAANLSELDKAALRSGVAGMVAARLAGVPLDQAFGPYMKAALMIHYIQAPVPWMIHYMQTPPPQFVVQPTPPYMQQAPPAWLIHYMQTPPPQFVVQPTTPYMQAPPPYMQAPPPYMQAPPPYMQAPPPPPSPQNPR